MVKQSRKKAETVITMEKLTGQGVITNEPVPEIAKVGQSNSGVVVAVLLLRVENNFHCGKVLNQVFAIL